MAKIDIRVSNIIDDFILDKDKAFWYVKLSDNSFVYQDDYRYSSTDISWIRLRNFCKKKKLYIKEVYIRFRSHTEKILENDGDGVFFRNKVIGNMSSQNRFYFVFGIIKNNIIKVNHWMVPELILEESDERDIIGNEDGIIWNLKK